MHNFALAVVLPLQMWFYGKKWSQSQSIAKKLLFMFDNKIECLLIKYSGSCLM